jgi:tetratricopeptide (TPR) repeat protein
MLLDQAADKIAAEPDLADLAPELEAIRGPVKARLRARDAYEHFVHDRDETLFHATLAAGENSRANRETARQWARAALGRVGLTPEGNGRLDLGPAFTADEKAVITTGSYAVFLMLAELDARRLPQQSDAQHKERLRQALALLDRADALGVRTRAIHLRRARYRTLLGDDAGAAREKDRVRALEARTDLGPQDHFFVGQELYSRGDLGPAAEEFRRALQLDGRHFWTHYFLGICSVAAGKPEVAVAHLTMCQDQKPDLVWIYLLRGFALGRMGNVTAAETDFDRALALDQSPAVCYVLYNNRGVLRVGRKETRAQGVGDLKEAAKLRPDQYQAHASLAEAYRLDDRFAEAGEELDKAIALAERQLRAGELKPATLALLHHSRARMALQRSERETAALQRSEREAAARDLAEAARLAGEDRSVRAPAEADLGRVRHMQERFAEALAAYDAALQADPGLVEILRGRGDVLLVQRRYAEAAAAFDGYLEKGGTPSAALYRQRGLARAQLGRHAEAIDDYGRALEAKPKPEDLAPLYRYRGQEYLVINALKPALGDFQTALRLDPDSADAALGCAYVRVKLGDLARGVTDAERALKGRPTAPRLWYGAARVYAQAAAQVKEEPGTEASQARLRSEYQQRAVELLRRALDRVPVAGRAQYWRDNVRRDAALYPIRNTVGFGRLAARYAGPG